MTTDSHTRAFLALTAEILGTQSPTAPVESLAERLSIEERGHRQQARAYLLEVAEEILDYAREIEDDDAAPEFPRIADRIEKARIEIAAADTLLRTRIRLRD